MSIDVYKAQTIIACYKNYCAHMSSTVSTKCVKVFKFYKHNRASSTGDIKVKQINYSELSQEPVFGMKFLSKKRLLCTSLKYILVINLDTRVITKLAKSYGFLDAFPLTKY